MLNNVALTTLLANPLMTLDPDEDFIDHLSTTNPQIGWENVLQEYVTINAIEQLDISVDLLFSIQHPDKLRKLISISRVVGIPTDSFIENRMRSDWIDKPYAMEMIGLFEQVRPDIPSKVWNKHLGQAIKSGLLEIAQRISTICKPTDTYTSLSHVLQLVIWTCSSWSSHSTRRAFEKLLFF
ncbi:hypothetical protein SAMD00019534_018040 [Acytostelium subglobosum LB1]|uniref:hypothetical protein n=1 Tax=Acytostelium subglobosum LB1 TaxID=1410327 RepID=UPI000644A5C2|nr:hypothetical protein SAMD00019534_018040 [Acytostelium subglobosum LB1]GAM18629.1 hypothetical protein SAMD00019534_018040 [Acytostelium subglobosum LB1]|eukprot:XP_012757849.1 hypothetical protein SAMD00019534_018040 [Acytostelium subglobosum LB1]